LEDQRRIGRRPNIAYTPPMNPRRVFMLLILGILIGLVVFFRP
jgi:hypothetical protein